MVPRRIQLLDHSFFLDAGRRRVFFSMDSSADIFDDVVCLQEEQDYLLDDSPMNLPPEYHTCDTRLLDPFSLTNSTTEVQSHPDSSTFASLPTKLYLPECPPSDHIASHPSVFTCTPSEPTSPLCRPSSPPPTDASPLTVGLEGSTCADKKEAASQSPVHTEESPIDTPVRKKLNSSVCTEVATCVADEEDPCVDSPTHKRPCRTPSPIRMSPPCVIKDTGVTPEQTTTPTTDHSPSIVPDPPLRRSTRKRKPVDRLIPCITHDPFYESLRVDAHTYNQTMGNLYRCKDQAEDVDATEDDEEEEEEDESDEYEEDGEDDESDIDVCT